MIDTHWLDNPRNIEVNFNDVTAALCDLRDIADAIPHRILHSRIDDESDITVNDAIASIFDFLTELERKAYE